MPSLITAVARLSRHSAAANLDDVRRRLDAELVPEHVAFVMARAERLHLDARLLWTWVEELGAHALVLALAAGHGLIGLQRMLDGQTAYDTDEALALAWLAEPELFGLADA